MRIPFSTSKIASSILLAVPITLLGSPEEDWPYKAINLPTDPAPALATKPVVVAIVDDGVRHTHQELQGYLWQNAAEIPFNRKDDDQNGYIDDVSGWDLADGDPDFTPTSKRASEFYHGTHLASVIVRLVETVLGKDSSDQIKLLPVKTLSDHAVRDYLKAGYSGIHYAAQQGADIILCAWSMGKIEPREAKILQTARAKGSLVIAAAGNYSGEQETFPAAHQDVLAVAALDEGDQRLDKSTYGTFVDLAAPGSNIPGAHTQSDQATQPQSGTSPAAALVAGTAALIKLFNPSFTADQIATALKSETTSLPINDSLVQGRLGSGKLNVAGAIAAGIFTSPSSKNTIVRKPQGFLRYARNDSESVVWTIDSPIEIMGTYLTMKSLDGKPGDGFLSIVQHPHAVNRPAAHRSIKVSELIGDYFVPGPSPVIMWFPEASQGELKWLIEYRVEPVNLPSKYCRGQVLVSASGTIDDGSGTSPYAPLSDCRWQIKAPPGKWIEFRFSKFETETNTDKLYFFSGSKTNVKPYAVISGTAGPPSFTLKYHEALLWFVTDRQTQYDGWSIDYQFVTPPAVTLTP